MRGYIMKTFKKLVFAIISLSIIVGNVNAMRQRTDLASVPEEGASVAAVKTVSVAVVKTPAVPCMMPQHASASAYLSQARMCFCRALEEPGFTTIRLESILLVALDGPNEQALAYLEAEQESHVVTRSLTRTVLYAAAHCRKEVVNAYLNAAERVNILYHILDDEILIAALLNRTEDKKEVALAYLYAAQRAGIMGRVLNAKVLRWTGPHDDPEVSKAYLAAAEAQNRLTPGFIAEEVIRKARLWAVIKATRCSVAEVAAAVAACVTPTTSSDFAAPAKPIMDDVAQLFATLTLDQSEVNG